MISVRNWLAYVLQPHRATYLRAANNRDSVACGEMVDGSNIYEGFLYNRYRESLLYF